jgi:integrase
MAKPWETMSISKATYYRRGYHKTLKTLNASQSLNVLAENGLSHKPWSAEYTQEILRLIKLFLQSSPELSKASAESWINELPIEKHSSRTWRHRALSAYAKTLGDSELISQIKSIYPRKPRGYRPKKLTIREDELQTLVRMATPTQRQVLILLAETGLRVSELAKLKIEDCNLSKGFLRVLGGKFDKDRVVPLSNPAKRVILEYGDWPDKRKAIQDRLVRLSKRTGIHITPHALRRYRITKWANNPKLSLSIVQKWSGHSSIVVTQGYVLIPDRDSIELVLEGGSYSY